MYYTPSLDHLFTFHEFSYRALQGRLKVIKSEFSDAVIVKLNASKAVLSNEFKRICQEWAQLRAAYQHHQEHVVDQWTATTPAVEPVTLNIYDLAISRGFSHNEAVQLQAQMSNPRTSARVRNAINSRLA